MNTSDWKLQCLSGTKQMFALILGKQTLLFRSLIEFLIGGTQIIQFFLQSYYVLHVDWEYEIRLAMGWQNNAKIENKIL